MPLAGETIIAGKIPGERINTDIEVSSSGDITTTETAVMTVVAAVVTGRIYRIKWVFNVDSSVAADTVLLRIREDSVSGTVLQTGRYRANSNVNYPVTQEAEYTADATEDKTIVASLQRESGSGNVQLIAAATQPSYLYVDYIRDA